MPGKVWSIMAELKPNLVYFKRNRPNQAGFGQTSEEIGPILPIPGPNWPMLVELVPEIEHAELKFDPVPAQFERFRPRLARVGQTSA